MFILETLQNTRKCYNTKIKFINHPRHQRQLPLKSETYKMAAPPPILCDICQATCIWPMNSDFFLLQWLKGDPSV